MIPGRALHRLAAVVCSLTTLERVVEPAIADVQKEYGAAELGWLRRARILFVGYLAILEVMLMCALQSPAATEDDRRAITRTFAWFAGLTVCASALILVLTVAVLPGVPPFFAALLTTLMLPSALPVGLTLGIAFGLGGRAISRRVVRAVLVMAFVAVVVSFSTMIWSWSVVTHSFRQSISDTVGGRQPVVRAASDISAAAMQQQPYFGPGGDRMARDKRRAWTQHLRNAVAFATPALALLALALLRHRAPRVMLFGACAGYFALLLIGEQLVYQGLPPLAAAWLANIVCATGAVFLVKRSTALPLGRPA
jgi:hypothetical protein